MKGIYLDKPRQAFITSVNLYKKNWKIWAIVGYYLYWEKKLWLDEEGIKEFFGVEVNESNFEKVKRELRTGYVKKDVLVGTYLTFEWLEGKDTAK